MIMELKLGSPYFFNEVPYGYFSVVVMRHKVSTSHMHRDVLSYFYCDVLRLWLFTGNWRT
jgi:hypothetical protein